MKIAFWGIGKTKFDSLITTESIFSKRIDHYAKLDIQYFELHKKWNKLPPKELKKKEAELILPQLTNKDYLIILDEKGKTLDSIAFANKIQNLRNRSTSRLVFLIGGAYGFDDQIYKRANEKMSLSAMTFSHQLIRSIFLEQLYRAFTIINNESYHNI